MTGIDMQNEHVQTEFPDVARVFIIDGIEMGPAIVILRVGAELPELILGAIEQLEKSDIPLTVGHLSAALSFKAVATGNQVSLRSAPLNNNYPMQLNAICQPGMAFGGIGTVLVDISQYKVTTYGGRGFPDAAPSNPYQPCTFDLALLASLPSFADTPTPDAPTTRTGAPKEIEGETKQEAANRKRAATNAKKKAAKVKAEAEASNVAV